MSRHNSMVLGHRISQYRHKNVIKIQEGLTVLVIGPHSDDIELGAACTIMQLLDKYKADVYYRLMSYDLKYDNKNNDYPRLVEAVRSAYRLGIQMYDMTHSLRSKLEKAMSAYEYVSQYSLNLDTLERTEKRVRSLRKNDYLSRSVGIPHFDAYTYPDTMFPKYWHEIQNSIEHLRDKMEQAGISPDLILVPCSDVHQDHATLSQAAARVFRKGEMRWQWEVLQFDSGNFVPNLYVDASGKTLWLRCVMDEEDAELLKVNRVGEVRGLLDGSDKKIDPNRVSPGQYYLKEGTYADRKVDLLMECFVREVRRNAAFIAPLRVLGTLAARGMQCGRDVEYAEAFQSRISIFLR